MPLTAPTAVRAVGRCARSHHANPARATGARAMIEAATLDGSA